MRGSNIKLLAFTLIELLVVIAIIGILAGIIIVSVSGATSRATIAKAQIFNNSLRNSIMMNIVGQWTFDDITDYNTTTYVLNSTAGNVPDSWGNNECQAYNGPVLSSDCVSGKCLTFTSASSQYLNCGTGVAIGTDSFTWSFWAKTTANSTMQTVLYRDITAGLTGWVGQFQLPHSSTTNGIFYITSGTYSTEIYRYVYPTNNNSNITDGKWHLFVGVCDRSKHVAPDVYLDGVLANGAIAGYCDQLTDNISSGALTIGRTLTSYPFNGSIDDVRVYNAAIPTSQVKEMYYAGLNNLYANGQITKDEYSQRVGDLAIK